MGYNSITPWIAQQPEVLYLDSSALIDELTIALNYLNSIVKRLTAPNVRDQIHRQNLLHVQMSEIVTTVTDCR